MGIFDARRTRGVHIGGQLRQQFARPPIGRNDDAPCAQRARSPILCVLPSQVNRRSVNTTGAHLPANDAGDSYRSDKGGARRLEEGVRHLCWIKLQRLGIDGCVHEGVRTAKARCTRLRVPGHLLLTPFLLSRRRLWVVGRVVIYGSCVCMLPREGGRAAMLQIAVHIALRDECQQLRCRDPLKVRSWVAP